MSYLKYEVRIEEDDMKDFYQTFMMRKKLNKWICKVKG